jgi:hypothetical protein
VIGVIGVILEIPMPQQSDKPEKNPAKPALQAKKEEKSPEKEDRPLRAKKIEFRSMAADEAVKHPLRAKKIKFRSRDIAEADDVKKRHDRDYPQA